MKYEPVALKQRLFNTKNVQKIYRFLNDYGASVIKEEIGRFNYDSYNDLDTFKLAVLRFLSADNDDFEIIYDSGINVANLRYLTAEQVEETLAKIKELEIERDNEMIEKIDKLMEKKKKMKKIICPDCFFERCKYLEDLNVVYCEKCGDYFELAFKKQQQVLNFKENEE